LLDLQRISNKILNKHVIKILFIDETKKKDASFSGDVWACLFSLVSRILEEFVKLPPAFASQVYSL